MSDATEVIAILLVRLHVSDGSLPHSHVGRHGKLNATHLHLARHQRIQTITGLLNNLVSCIELSFDNLLNLVPFQCTNTIAARWARMPSLSRVHEAMAWHCPT